MFKFLLLIIGLLLVCNSYLMLYDKNAYSFSRLAPAQSCTTLQCVRNQIDEIDSMIIQLIGMRLSYVRKAGELKSNSQDLYDKNREEYILKKVNLLAEKEGFSGILAQEIYKTLLMQSRLFEAQFIKK